MDEAAGCDWGCRVMNVCVREGTREKKETKRERERKREKDMK